MYQGNYHLRASASHGHRIAAVIDAPAAWRGSWGRSDIWGRCTHCGGLAARGKCQACGWMVACAWCGSVRTPDGWQQARHWQEPGRTSHGICEDCRQEQRRQLCANGSLAEQPQPSLLKERGDV